MLTRIPVTAISEAEGGAVWEQLILMAPCPIIGLSATVGNPHDFNRWLESVQKAHGLYLLLSEKNLGLILVFPQDTNTPLYYIRIATVTFASSYGMRLLGLRLFSLVLGKRYQAIPWFSFIPYRLLNFARKRSRATFR
jgi:hypothetical protein